MDIRTSQALAGYRAAMKTGPAAGGAAKPSGAGGALAGAAQEFQATLAKSEQLATETMQGKADPHALVEALENTQLAVETAVTIRDRVVEAYQEILRMPV